MKTIAVLGLASTLLAGCATVSQRPLDTKAAASWKGESISFVRHEVPDFSAMTAGKAAFAMFGALAMISAGNELVAQNQVGDPANDISKALLAALSSQYELKAIDQPIEKADASALTQAEAQGSRFAIDVQTVNWGFAYFPSNWTHYRVIYGATAKVVDLKTQQVVAEGSCKSMPETEANAPTYEDLLAENAARLKQELATAAKACIGQLTVGMLARSS